MVGLGILALLIGIPLAWYPSIAAARRTNDSGVQKFSSSPKMVASLVFERILYLVAIILILAGITMLAIASS